jgi:hypothetical protein
MTAHTKKILSSQLDNKKPFKKIHFYFINIYHMAKLFKLFTQYTSYKTNRFVEVGHAS